MDRMRSSGTRSQKGLDSMTPAISNPRMTKTMASRTRSDPYHSFKFVVFQLQCAETIHLFVVYPHLTSSCSRLRKNI